MEQPRKFYRLATFIVRVISRLYFRIEIHHLDRVPRSGAFMITPTHTSHLDPPMVGAFIPNECCYLSRESILRIPLLGWLCRQLNAYGIKRGASDREALRLCRSILASGRPLVFFPEGTRSKDGCLGSIQRGFAMILDGLNVPYVPVVIQDTFKALPRNTFFPRPVKIHMYFGNPTNLPKRLDGEASKDYLSRCADALKDQYIALGANIKAIIDEKKP